MDILKVTEDEITFTVVGREVPFLSVLFHQLADGRRRIISATPIYRTETLGQTVYAKKAAP